MIHIVAESVALSLRRSTGDIYLDAQIFAGFMFVGASFCTLFLRSWKIGQVEKEVVTQGERDHGEDTRPAIIKSRDSVSPNMLIFRRLFQLKRV